jgi:hypothetical protein
LLRTAGSAERGSDVPRGPERLAQEDGRRAAREAHGPPAALRDPIFATRNWLGRVEVFLDWVA